MDDWQFEVVVQARLQDFFISELLKGFIYRIFSAIVVLTIIALMTGCLAEREVGFRSYAAFLANQEGKPNVLPAILVEKIRGDYQIDFEQVRYFTNIDTVSGKVVTIGNKIYFPNRFLPSQAEHIRRMLHELRHVEQYRRDGQLFFQRYSVAAINSSLIAFGDGLTKGTFDSHADFEYEADALAAEKLVFAKVKPLCDDYICPGIAHERAKID